MVVIMFWILNVFCRKLVAILKLQEVVDALRGGAWWEVYGSFQADLPWVPSISFSFSGMRQAVMLHHSVSSHDMLPHSSPEPVMG